jgi:hypothetical protein
MRPLSFATPFTFALACAGAWPLLATTACKKTEPAKPVVLLTADAALPSLATNRVARVDFNRAAMRLNLPLFWIADKDGDSTVDPDEVTGLLFYADAPVWVEDGRFTPAFGDAYGRIAQLVGRGDESQRPGLTAAESRRRAVVGQDLDFGRPTLVLTDLGGASPAERAFVDKMLEVAAAIDALHEAQLGLGPLAAQVPGDDPQSQSLFRRNRGPACVGPRTELDPACSAIPGGVRPKVGVYPDALQADAKFCAALEARKDAATLLGPFTAVREQGSALVAVPYHQAWPELMNDVATKLRAAAQTLPGDEAALAAYLGAAATAFESNDWWPADEAWAKIGPGQSRWYVRVAPDETYWEPCAHKAGFALVLARVSPASLAWQARLTPILQDMENAVAERAGKPYRARPVAIHLPDFIDIVINAGDARGPLGATIGQSLPNVGPVANESRGRTVAMSNLYTDPDSLAARRSQAASLLDRPSLAAYVDDPEPGLVTTILHEAGHNLGPAHQYAVRGQIDELIFGGGLAAMLEELKAQTAALFLVDLLVQKQIVSAEQAARIYTDAMVWAFGHIAQGMTTATGERKAYSQLAAVQLGFFLDEGAITWDPTATAADGTSTGAFTLHLDKFAATARELMAVAAGIKARGDRAGALELSKRYVEGPVVPQAAIAERWLVHPKASFVYAIKR